MAAQEVLEALQRMESANILTVGHNGNDLAVDRLAVNQNLPFKTLAAAKAFAKSGDTIVVQPGSYTAINLLKNGVNWFFMPGATVTRTQTASEGAIFDDSPFGANGACTSIIDGYGDFLGTHPNIDQWEFRGTVVHLENAGSSVRFRCRKVTQSGDCVGAVFSFAVLNCSLCVLEFSDWAGSSLQGFNNCVYWEKGELWTRFDRIVESFTGGGSYTLWAKEPLGGANANWYIIGNLVDHPSYSPFIIEGNSPNYKVWYNVVETRGGPDGGLGNPSLALGVLEQIGGGKLYVTAQKINSSRLAQSARIGACIWQTGGELWAMVEKMTAVSTATQGGSVPVFINQSGGTSDIQCLHYEHIGNFSANGIRIQGGTANLSLGRLAVLNGKGLDHSGGVSRVKGLRIDTLNTNNAANNPVSLGSAGCILDGCTLLAPAAADSITGAFTVKIYGTTYANKAKNAGTTVQAGLGTLVADANVT